MSKEKNKKGSKVFVIVIVILIVLNILVYLYGKEPTLTVQNQTVEYGTSMTVGDLIASVSFGKLTNQDDEIDTSTLGSQTVKVICKNSLGRGYSLDVQITVVDLEEPTIYGAASQTIAVGEEVDLLEGVYASDNTSEDVAVYFSGEIDYETAGVYTITYYAQDSSGNMAVQEVVITVE